MPINNFTRSAIFTSDAILQETIAKQFKRKKMCPADDVLVYRVVARVITGFQICKPVFVFYFIPVYHNNYETPYNNRQNMYF